MFFSSHKHDSFLFLLWLSSAWEWGEEEEEEELYCKWAIIQLGQSLPLYLSLTTAFSLRLPLTLCSFFSPYGILESQIFRLFLSTFHFSLFAASLLFCDLPLLNWTLPLSVLLVAEVGQNLRRAQLCLCTVLSCSLRACLNFVIVLKLQARAALTGIPDSLLPHIGHLCVLSFFQTQRNYGANSQFISPKQLGRGEWRVKRKHMWSSLKSMNCLHTVPMSQNIMTTHRWSE